MEADSVVPDMVDTVPVHVLHVRWSAGVEAAMGNELTPTKVRYPPIELRWPAQRDALYTLIMSDLDPPSRAEPTNREALHWLVVNIPGGDIPRGDTYTEYIGSGPPEGSGLHRYVLMVFKQTEKLTNVDRPRVTDRQIDGRFGFKTKDFVKQYKLEPRPVAGNFYQAKFDSYVPILHAQLSTANAADAEA